MIVNYDIVPTIIYMELSDENRPLSLFWYPKDLPEYICRYVEKKIYSLTSGERNFLPEILLVFPLSSLRKKMLIKYFIKQENGKCVKSALCFIFDESEDYIFYRYLNYFDYYFNESILRIIELEGSDHNNGFVFDEVIKLRDNICFSIKDLQSQSKYFPQPEKKPTVKNQAQNFLMRKFKVIVLGDPSVGKTSTLLKFTDDVFIRAYVPTMGLNITHKRFHVNNKAVELVLWDMGGQTKFGQIRNQFYEGATAFLLLFDLTNPDSFANIPKWYKEVKYHFPALSDLDGYLVGNKSDMVKERIVNRIDAERLSRVLNIKYLETSALTGDNLKYLFTYLARSLINSHKTN